MTIRTTAAALMADLGCKFQFSGTILICSEQLECSWLSDKSPCMSRCISGSARLVGNARLVSIRTVPTQPRSRSVTALGVDATVP